MTLRMYKDGYQGILIGDSFIVPESDWDSMAALNFIGGSPIGNSRVKVGSQNDDPKKNFYDNFSSTYTLLLLDFVPFFFLS